MLRRDLGVVLLNIVARLAKNFEVADYRVLDQFILQEATSSRPSV